MSDEQSKKFIEERQQFLRSQVHLLSQESRDITNQVCVKTVINFIIKGLDSNNEQLRNEMLSVFPKFFEQESNFHESVSNG